MQQEANLLLTSGAFQKGQTLLGREDKKSCHSMPREMTERRKKTARVFSSALSGEAFRAKDEGISAAQRPHRTPESDKLAQKPSSNVTSHHPDISQDSYCCCIPYGKAGFPPSHPINTSTAESIQVVRAITRTGTNQHGSLQLGRPRALPGFFTHAAFSGPSQRNSTTSFFP